MSFSLFGTLSLWANGKKHLCNVIWDLLACWCHSPVVRRQGLLGSHWAGVLQCRSPGIAITTLVSVTAGKYVFWGNTCAFNPLFCQFWCLIILSSCQTSLFEALWALPGSRQTPWDTMPAQMWLAQLYTWLPFSLNDPGNTIHWQWQQVICPGLCKLSDGWYGEAPCI